VDLAGGGGRYRLSPGRLNLDSSAELYRATETNPEDVGGVLLTQTDIPLSVPNDNPDPPFRQQPSGSSGFFWIDGPGQLKSVSGNTVDSETQVENFTSTVMSPPDADGITTSCISQWHLKLVIKPGGVLDTTNTTAGTGTISTNF